MPNNKAELAHDLPGTTLTLDLKLVEGRVINTMNPAAQPEYGEGCARWVKLPKSVALFPSDPGTFCGIYGQPLLLHLISHRIWNGRLAPDRLPKRNQV